MRLGSALALAAAVPALGFATGLALRDSIAPRPDPHLELELRAEAGRRGLDALTALESEHRAAEVARNDAERARAEALALASALDARAVVGADRGEIDPSRGVVVRFPGVAAGATVALALPEIAALLAAAGSRPLARAGAERAWAVGLAGGDTRAIAAVAIPKPIPRATARAAANDLVALAAPVALPDTALARTAAVLPALLAILSAVLAALWIRRRFSLPIAASLDAADRFAHGDRAARADPARGGRDAREIARAINAAIGAADRPPSPALAGEARALAVGIRSLGHGDLVTEVPAPTGPLGVIQDALAGARRDLCERLSALSRSAFELGAGLGEVVLGARRIERAAGETVELLAKIDADAATDGEDARRSVATLGRALEELASLVSAHRRVALQLRSEVSAALRRAGDLGTVSDRLLGTAQGSQAIDGALDLLAAIAATGETVAVRGLEGAGMPSGQVMMVVRRGRESLEALKNEARALGGAIAEVADGLGAIVDAPPVLAPELEASTVAALQGLALAAVRASERASEGLRSLERAARQLEAAGREVAAGAEVAREAGPELTLAAAGFDLGDAQDRALIERLTAARSAFEDLTRDGSNGALAAVQQAAEEARARLSRLIALHEAAVDLLRERRLT